MDNKLNGLIRALGKQAMLTSAGMDSVEATETVFNQVTGYPVSSTYKLQLQIMKESLQTSLTIMLNSMSNDSAEELILSLVPISFRSRRHNVPNMVIKGIVMFKTDWAFELADPVTCLYQETLSIDDMTIEEMIVVIEFIERGL